MSRARANYPLNYPLTLNSNDSQRQKISPDTRLYLKKIRSHHSKQRKTQLHTELPPPQKKSMFLKSKNNDHFYLHNISRELLREKCRTTKCSFEKSTKKQQRNVPSVDVQSLLATVPITPIVAESRLRKPERSRTHLIKNHTPDHCDPNFFGSTIGGAVRPIA